MISFEINASKVLNKLKKLSNSQGQAVHSALVKAGFYVEGEVKESIAGRRGETRSVDTGMFFDSVQTKSVDLLNVEVFSNVEYAGYLEEGTRFIDARNHFRNSALRSKGEVVRILDSEVKKII